MFYKHFFIWPASTALAEGWEFTATAGTFNYFISETRSAWRAFAGEKERERAIKQTSFISKAIRRKSEPENTESTSSSHISIM